MNNQEHLFAGGHTTLDQILSNHACGGHRAVQSYLNVRRSQISRRLAEQRAIGASRVEDEALLTAFDEAAVIFDAICRVMNQGGHA